MSPSSENLPIWQEETVGAATLRYLVMGSGPPVVLLHGLSGSVAWWRHNLRQLSSSFRLYAPDLMRFGGGHPRPRFALRHSPEMIASWMHSIGLSSAAFVGHSMGGFIAASLAVEYPQMVDKLVLVSAAIFPPGKARLSPRHLLRWLLNFPPDLLPVVLRDAWWITPVELWRAAREIFAMDLFPRLGQIGSRTLIIWGSEDGLLPAYLGGDLKEAIKGADLRIFETVGHCPMWEAPERFNSEVEEFLLR